MITKGCMFSGCKEQHHAKNYCGGHYAQWRAAAGRRGLRPVKAVDPRLPGTSDERFWARVDKNGPKGCWLWTGKPTDKGYCRVDFDGTHMYGHRYAYEQLVGPIPDGLQVDHMCHETLCVNPKHLQTVTQAENNENRAGASRNSKTGILGVYWCADSDKYRTVAAKHGRAYYNGSYDNIEDAERAAIALRLRLFTNNLVDRNEVP